MAQRRGLILTSSPSLQGSLISAFASRYGLDLQNITLVTRVGKSDFADLEKGAFMVALSLSDIVGYHDASIIGQEGSLLRPGATLIIQEPLDQGHTEEVKHACW